MKVEKRGKASFDQRDNRNKAQWNLCTTVVRRFLEWGLEAELGLIKCHVKKFGELQGRKGLCILN